MKFLIQIGIFSGIKIEFGLEYIELIGPEGVV